MDLLSHLRGGSVYLDTNVFIYYMEGFEEYRPQLVALFRGIDERDLTGVTSLLTLAEALVRPFRQGDTARVEAYRTLLRSRDGFLVEPISEDILIEAARLRGRSRIRLPDAIHVATAIRSGSRSYLTNDRRMKGVEGIEVIVLADAVTD